MDRLTRVTQSTELKKTLRDSVILASQPSERVLRPATIIRAWQDGVASLEPLGDCEVHYLTRQLLESISEWAIERGDNEISLPSLILAILIQEDPEAMRTMQSHSVEREELFRVSLEQSGFDPSDRPTLTPMDPSGTADIRPILLSDLPAELQEDVRTHIQAIGDMFSDHTWDSMWSRERSWCNERAQMYNLTSDQEGSLVGHLLHETQKLAKEKYPAFVPWDDLRKQGGHATYVAR